MKIRFITIIISALALMSYANSDFKYVKTNNGVEFTVGGLKKRIAIYDKNIVHVSVTKENSEFIDSSLVVILKPKAVDFSVHDNNDLVIETDYLSIKVEKATGKISFYNNKNEIYLKEHENITPIIKDTLISEQTFFKVKQGFQLKKDEGIFGLGQFQDGIMNYRNTDVLLVQANKIAIVPLLVSTNNYGILWDNYSHSNFHDGNDGTFFSAEVADQIDYYFIGSNSMDGVISGYRKLTGKAPMFSKKAFGYWQSKERYNSFKELHEVVKKYRENNIPIDNIVQDWRYWGENEQWSSMYFNLKHFANPSKNIKELHSENVDIMVSIWPSLGPETQIFKDMKAKDYLLEPDHWCGGKIYDAYNPKARELYWSHMKEGLSKNGVDAFWMDGTEPEFSGTGNQETTEKEILKVGKTAAGPIAKYLNTYALVTSEGVYGGHREFTDKKRVFILTRSSWAGQQRNATVTWSGDVSASFDNMKKQISAGLNFCMAGIPYWTHDIGGFFLGSYRNGIDDPAYQELYTRWFQFGAFSPIFRSHGTGTPREVWQFKNRNPMFYDALLKTINLRYRLLPYIYSTAWQVTENDYTIMRGLVMDFSHDQEVFNITDQYMFGPSMLVKPITKSMYHDVEKLPPTIASAYLRSSNNKEGLDASYFKDTKLKKLVYSGIEKEINHNWNGGGLPQGVPETNFSVRWKGSLIAPLTGEYKITSLVDDGVRMWLGDKLIIDEWNAGEKYKSSEVKLKKGQEYPVKVEYFQEAGGAKVNIGWQIPSDKKDAIEKSKVDEMYLPKHIGWFDFWTNEWHSGGQTISKEFPIDVFPLFIKAGSIIPMGPVQQYVDEKPNHPIEIRIYAGEDCEFTLYEDEGNNYNYEKGAYNTIELVWNEQNRSLTIGESEGSFEGFKKEKDFKIVLIEKSNSSTNKTIKGCRYNGESIKIEF